MRQKLLVPRRHHEPPAEVGAAEDPTQWLLVNEAGWGLPHGPGGILAALAVGYVTVGIGGWIAARLRSRRR